MNQLTKFRQRERKQCFCNVFYFGAKPKCEVHTSWTPAASSSAWYEAKVEWYDAPTVGIVDWSF